MNEVSTEEGHNLRLEQLEQLRLDLIEATLTWSETADQISAEDINAIIDHVVHGRDA